MRGNKKLYFVLICVFLLMGAIFITNYYSLTNGSLATDSGWDVDYDSGSSDGVDLFSLIYLAIEYPLVTFIVIVIIVVITTIENNKKRKANGSNFDSIKNSSYDSDTKKLLSEAYGIFYSTQMAWMNFDYQRLKSLVTDELYNSYYNQLETLRLKNQRNIMRDFTVKSAQLLSKKEEDNKITIVVGMNVTFYDYVIDQSNNQVVRGSDIRKVDMHYHITFVSQIGKEDMCPNCGAPLETPNYCDYCKSHIQGLTSEMRISKKEVIKQELQQ